MPVTSKKSGESKPEFLTTPYFEFYKEKPDYRILFPFGCIGAFRRYCDGTVSQKSLDSQCMLGIALGRSEYTNGMIFYNPESDSFCTSADYMLDKHQMIGEVFPSISYDGGLITNVLSNKGDQPTRFKINDEVFMQCQDTFDIIPVTVKMVPTSKTKIYTVTDENGNDIDVKRKHLYAENEVPASGIPSV